MLTTRSMEPAVIRPLLLCRGDPDLYALAMDFDELKHWRLVHDLLAPWSGCGVFSGRS